MMTETAHTTEMQRFDYDEKRQQVSDLELMITDFKRTASELDQQVKIEQQSCGITDVTHYAYPTFARAALARRDNLLASVADLEKRLARAHRELSEAQEQLKLSSAVGGFEAQKQLKSAVRRRSPRFIAASGGSR